MYHKFLPIAIFSGIVSGSVLENYLTVQKKTPELPETQALVQPLKSTETNIEYFDKVITITNERRFKSILCNLTDKQAIYTEQSLRKLGLSKPQKGAKVFLSFKKENQKNILLKLHYYHKAHYFEIDTADNKLTIKKHPIKRVMKQVEGSINNCFYKTAVSSGTPSAIIEECVSGMKECTDFKKSVPKGTKFNIIYDVIEMPNGYQFLPQLKYLEFFIKEKSIRIYNFQKVSGGKEFFNENGMLLKKTAFTNPLKMKKIKVSSPFGWRLHPIKKTYKLHCGIDYKAPKGTPVFSTASGYVSFAGTMSGYGKIVEVNHGYGYKTRYAHLNRIYTKQGDYVNQNASIGEVGHTGTSTGDHLHFEIRLNNKPINPKNHVYIPAYKLTGEDLRRFCVFKKSIHNFINQEQNLMA